MKTITEYQTDLAPTGRAKCRCCRKLIVKGSPRVFYNKLSKKSVFSRKAQNKVEISYIDKACLCSNCAPDYLDRELKYAKVAVKDNWETLKKFNKAVQKYKKT